MRDETLVLVHLADPAASVETVGLIPSAPALRPADSFTSAAIPGRLAALDIGVTSPDAAGAGDDCCDAMYRRKRADYAAHSAELAAQDIVYKPLVWSTFGRAHPETDTILRSLAVVAARRRGLPDHALLLRRARAAIGVQLMTRAVRMLWACIPRAAAEEEQLLHGGAAAGDGPPQRRDVRLAHDGADVPRAAEGANEDESRFEAASPEATVSTPGGAARRANARGPEFFAALRLVYGRGPPAVHMAVAPAVE